MKANYFDYQLMPNGFEKTLQKGMAGLSNFQSGVSFGAGTMAEQIDRLKEEIGTADAIVIGAGAGLSTAAGHVYSGERFYDIFGDFAEAFGIRDMYSGGFFPFPDEETRWAFWSRMIWFNRYRACTKPVYKDLLDLVRDKDFFVITTNVDHQFQLAGFPKERLFYTQGDYGSFQRAIPDEPVVYDNEDMVKAMMESQGYVMDKTGDYVLPEGVTAALRVPTELVPKDPENGSALKMHLRGDDSFVENEGWHKASAAYDTFLRRVEGKHVLFLELGIGGNTPVIVKYPFWIMTLENEKAVYACVNLGEAFCPREIEARSICLDMDIGELLKMLK